VLNIFLDMIVENPWPNDHEEDSSSTEQPTEAELVFIAQAVMRNLAAHLPEDQTWGPHATRTQFVYLHWCKLGKPSAQAIKKGKHVGTKGQSPVGPPVASTYQQRSPVPQEGPEEDGSDEELEKEAKNAELQQIESKMSNIDGTIKILRESMDKLQGSANKGLQGLVTLELQKRAALEDKKKKLLESSTVPLYSPFTLAKQAKMKGTVDQCVSLIRKFALEENVDPVACYRFMVSSGKMRKTSVWDAFQRLKSFERAGMSSNTCTIFNDSL